MPTAAIVVAVASCALLVVALTRLPYWRARPSSRPLTIIVFAMALSTVLRLPDIADTVFDPFLFRLLGIHNVTELAAACAGVFAFMTVVELVASTVSDRPALWHRIFRVVTPLVATVTAVGFLTSPAIAEPSGAIFRDFPLERGLAVFWCLYVGTLLAAALSAQIYLVRLIRLPGVRHSPLGRPLLLMTAGALAALLPALNLMFRLRMHAGGTPQWYRDNAIVIGQVAALLPLAFIGAAAVAYSATVLPDRIRRYRAIRRSSDRYAEVLGSGVDVIVPRDARTFATRRAAWRGSRSPMITHQMMVVLADAAIQSGESGRPKASSM